ncbi:hypothetical protein NL676_002995 [Syzygium grande]|nr:hypothetical protein NL676_002995 [Syzygium grande]
MWRRRRTSGVHERRCTSNGATSRATAVVTHRYCSRTTRWCLAGDLHGLDWFSAKSALVAVDWSLDREETSRSRHVKVEIVRISWAAALGTLGGSNVGRKVTKLTSWTHGFSDEDLLVLLTVAGWSKKLSYGVQGDHEGE